jgi:hypothetical protein
MIGNKGNKFFRVLISFILVLAFILITKPDTIQAASKPSVASKMTIGTGSIISYDYTYSKSDYYTLEVNNPVKKATYSFSSSNKNIVTVKAKGTKAYLTGLQAGSATITCQQKLNGKTTKIGTCKVTVKNATVVSEEYEGLSMGTSTAVYLYYTLRNNDATYSYVSDSKNFTMKDNIIKDTGSNDIYIVSQTYTAKQPGTYKVTVKETYNKKTRVVGEVKFEVIKATVAKEQTMIVEDNLWGFYLINYSRGDVNYLFDIADETIVEGYVEEGTVYLRAKNIGTTEVKIYEGTTTTNKGNYIGTCIITVKELTLDSIESYFYSTETYVGGSSIGFEVYKYPYNAPGTITIASSDPNIATVGELNEYNYAEITPVSEGTVTITITCGEFNITKTITIYADQDSMYGW